MFDLESFISEYVIGRSESMFHTDLEANRDRLEQAICGRSVLVIGGAGSIGSAFIKEILHYGPSALVVVDINENALTELTRDLRSSPDIRLPKSYISYPMDYASHVFEKMYRTHGGFDIVGNFSAHKHVRSEKDIYAVEALLRNNVLNARKLLELLAEYPPRSYFCVSTDKAANPVNIMGASKRIMEDLIFSFSDRFPVKTARFANVAFSNGSLPEGFLERIAKKQPLSAPTDVRRFFVSPKESGQICLLSCVLGENRAILYPRLEEKHMKTFDGIARDLLHVHGYEVFECESDEEAIEMAQELKDGGSRYPVRFSVSDTSGEKPFEEFVTSGEQTDEQRFISLGVIVGKPMPDQIRLNAMLRELEELFDQTVATKEDVVRILQGYLPEFRHIETGRSLDEKM